MLNTATVAPGVGGSVTVAHDGRFGDLAGKTVALEPATGFSFDSPMLPRIKLELDPGFGGAGAQAPALFFRSGRQARIRSREAPAPRLQENIEPRLSGWGRIAVAGREVRSEDLERITRDVPLCRGLGRSYGDSSLPPPGRPVVAGTRLADRILAFDPATGVLRAEAGLSLFELNRRLPAPRLLRPRGPRHPVHHPGGHGGRRRPRQEPPPDGLLRRPRAARSRCAWPTAASWSARPTVEPDLFRATLGGMGLTGHILEVECRLLRVPSPVDPRGERAHRRHRPVHGRP